MQEKYDSSALWVALSEHSDGNLFSVYPKLLAELLLQEEAARQDGDTSEAEKLVLPSDREWRLQQYFFLVTMQRDITDEDEDEKVVQPPEETPEEWAPWSFVVPTKNPRAPTPVTIKTAPGPAWDISQVLKAARLLCKPPMHVDFMDEQEMRCVYSLIYDVFRYKSILDQAIDHTDFFIDFPQFIEHRHATWLFLMELARRSWGARNRADMERATKLLNEAGSPFKEIENELWQQRVHFAAAIARIRIKHRAFSMADLLPLHLRDERISACVNKATVTGWVNTFKAKKVALLVKRLHELGYSYSSSRQLCAGEYRFDRVCPRFITLRPVENVGFGQMDLVKEGVIVLQEREFCEGASTLCRALKANALRGVVAQTHASSPRCSAYLAAQLRELAAVLKAQAPAAPATPQLGRLVVFGAGDKVTSYVGALRDLGIDASEAPHSDAPVYVLRDQVYNETPPVINALDGVVAVVTSYVGALRDLGIDASEAPHSDAPVYVLSDQVYNETPAVINALDGVVAVLATPPNSYSAVTDPIDLVCGRGGDLAMLEILTESEIDSNGKTRVQSILEEQKKTLRTLMSKPQIQLILYETHSALEAENQAQVTRAVAEANRLARERHALLKKKHRTHSPQKHTADTTNNDTVMETDTITETEPTDADDVGVTSTTIKKQGNSPPNRSRPQSKENSSEKRDSVDTSSRPGTTKTRPIPQLPQPDADPVPKDPDKDNPDVYVPDCDLFEVGTLPNLGNGLDINYILDRDGCYLGLIQRKEPSDEYATPGKKEVTHMDAKYMIRVAEERGLFGQGAQPPPPPRRKKPELNNDKKRKRKNSFEIERVCAPTYASLSRSTRRGSAPACVPPREPCERHARRHAAAALSAAHCTCDCRHRAQYRRSSLDAPPVPRPDPVCRLPFPVTVHDLRLKTVLHHKVVTITSS